jgi:hypothetical protein
MRMNRTYPLLRCSVAWPQRSVLVSAGSKYQPPSINEINNFDQKPNSRETGKGSKQDWPSSESVCEYILSPLLCASSSSLWNHQLVDYVISALASQLWQVDKLILPGRPQLKMTKFPNEWYWNILIPSALSYLSLPLNLTMLLTNLASSCGIESCLKTQINSYVSRKIVHHDFFRGFMTLFQDDSSIFFWIDEVDIQTQFLKI